MNADEKPTKLADPNLLRIWKDILRERGIEISWGELWTLTLH